jgi:hypothetical protein
MRAIPIVMERDTRAIAEYTIILLIKALSTPTLVIIEFLDNLFFSSIPI